MVGNFLSAVSGNKAVCEELAEKLQDEGWSVLTTSRRPGRLARLLDMVSVAWGRRRDYAVAQVDLFSGLSFGWAEAVCWVLRRARKPYVLTLHGGNLPHFARRWPGRVRRLLMSAGAVTTPSPYLLEGLGSYREDLRLLPNPLDLSAYSFRVRDHARPTFIWLRAFHEIYNAPLAVKALGLLAAEFPDARLTMVGPDRRDGSLQETEREAARLGMTERVTLQGGVAKSEVPRRLEQGDIFLNTTNIDNTPVSVLEAMACGMCVVSTNVGGIPYLLEDDTNALLVPAGDPRAMADAIRRILTEPGLSARLSRNARRTVEGFDWSAILPRWEGLLAEVARSSGGAPISRTAPAATRVERADERSCADAENRDD